MNRGNYQLDRCFPEIHDASYGDKFADLVGPDEGMVVVVVEVNVEVGGGVVA